jgi:predicted transcriptional regulator
MEKTLKEKILEEMVVDYSDALEKHFDIAKNFINITTTGKIHVIDKERFNNGEQIMLYLIGKLYSKKADLTENVDVSNKELMEELGMAKGSILWATKDLRDKNLIKTTKSGAHIIPLNNVERVLREIVNKTTKKV